MSATARPAPPADRAAAFPGGQSGRARRRPCPGDVSQGHPSPPGHTQGLQARPSCHPPLADPTLSMHPASDSPRRDSILRQCPARPPGARRDSCHWLFRLRLIVWHHLLARILPMHTAALHRCLLACLALVSLGLASCATPLSKTECMAMDWRTIGYEDGAAGHPGSRISVHRRACGEHGVAPDFDAYQAGRSEGLVEFCTAANGYRIGVAGGEYADVCPVDREDDFLRAFSEGRELYALRERVRSSDSQLGARRRELERLEKAVTKNA